MKSRFAILSCAWLAVASLSGCALLSGKTTQPPVTQAQQPLYRLPVWKMEGRIGAKFKDEGWNANLFWEHGGGQDRLRISGPFSQGTVSIIVQSDLVYINEGNGVTSSSRNPDEWLKQRLGFAVPLCSLRYWVLGLPAPDVEYQAEHDATGGIRGFKQQGWVLAFERFDNVGNFVLPKKMTIQGGDVMLKLIADDWVLN